MNFLTDTVLLNSGIMMCGYGTGVYYTWEQTYKAVGIPYLANIDQSSFVNKIQGGADQLLNQAICWQLQSNLSSFKLLELEAE